MESLYTRVVGIRGLDRRPQRGEFLGINWESPQVRGLGSCWPMWGGGQTEIDLISGYIAYPTNCLTYYDPQFGSVYYGDNGGTPRGGGAPVRPRYYNVGAFSAGQSGSTIATGYPANMDPGAYGVSGRPGSSFSMTAWVKLASAGGYVINGSDMTTANSPSNAYIASFAASSGSFPGWGFGVTSNALTTSIVVELDIDGGASQSTIVGNIAINDGNWHHIAGVYEGVGNNLQNGGHMRCYVDGVLDTTDLNGGAVGTGAVVVPGIQSWLDSSPWGTAIGSDTDFTTAQWNGMFCEFRFYMRVLTVSDLQAMIHPDTRWELYNTLHQLATSWPAALSVFIYDSDYGSSLENNLEILLPSGDIPSGSESPFISSSPYDQESSSELESILMSQLISESYLSIESYLPIILPSESGSCSESSSESFSLYNPDNPSGLENIIRYLSDDDSGSGSEQGISSYAIYFSESGSVQEQSFSSIFNYESTLGIESNLISISFYDSELSSGIESYLLASAIFNYDYSTESESYYLISSLFNYDNPSVTESYLLSLSSYIIDSITGSDLNSISSSQYPPPDSALSYEQIIIIILDPENPIGLENQFITVQLNVSAAFAADSAVATEANTLTIAISDSDNPLVVENQFIQSNLWSQDQSSSIDNSSLFTSIIGYDQSLSSEQYYISLLSFSSDTGTGIDYQISISIVYSYSSDSAFASENSYTTTVTPPPPSTGQIQWTDFVLFFQSFVLLLRNSNLFGIKSVDFVVWENNAIKWPVGPAPFLIIEPGTFPSSSEGIGGGRWSKTYTSELKIHVIVDNIFDISFRDDNLITSYNLQVSPYQLIDQIINVMEQSYPIDYTGLLTLVELPYSQSVSAPKRYPGSNSYSYITILYYIKICEKMLSNVIDAMPAMPIPQNV